MPLLYPKSGIPFVPSPRLLLGVFDVYDREEELERVLGGFNPNAEDQVATLLERFFFPAFNEANGYTAAHKSALLASIRQALSDSSFNFHSLLQPAENGDTFCLPRSWANADPRAFVQYAYTLLRTRWQDEIERSGVTNLPLSAL